MPLTCPRACWPGSAGSRIRCGAGSPPPSETRIRTLIQAIGADLLDDLTGGWLRALADAGRLDEALTAIAIDGKWLRGVLDGQVKLFAAMLHDQKVIIGQVRVPDDTTEVTQVKELLRGVDLENAVVTADAAHSCRETAQYIAGKGEDGGREPDYFLFVKGNAPSLQRAALAPSRPAAPAAPPTTRSWTVPTAASPGAPSGPPTPATLTSRTSSASPGSAATATTPTAP